jgi:rifampicin phosphotransferase
MALTTAYACADGTPFPVEWPDEKTAALTWEWDGEHYPAPLPPLEAAIWPLGYPGAQRAFAEAGQVAPPFAWPPITPHGFFYLCTADLPAEQEAGQLEAATRLREQHGGLWGVWERHCLPRVEAACRTLQQAVDTTPIASLAETWSYAFHTTLVTVETDWPLVRRLRELCREAMGDAGNLLAAELTQGRFGATGEIDAAVLRLAQIAKEAPDARAALAAVDPVAALEGIGRSSSSAAVLSDLLRRFDQQYGWRAQGWALTAPTWREQPAALLRLVHILAERDHTRSEEPVMGAAIARHAAAVREIEARLSGDETRLAELRGLLTQLEQYVPMREARAHWQLVAAGSLRGALLRRGRRLVEAGALRDPEEVFHLLPEEIDGSPAGTQVEFATVIASRRAEQSRWLECTPPSEIGGGHEPGEQTAEPAVSDDGHVVKGIGASRGVATGRARVLGDIDEAERLEPGDILVCRMTSPAWSPLFAIAAAVVTDTGGLLSHPAIEAREYGIPCVVATGDATLRIPEGAVISVDGALGTVRVLGAGMEI